MKGHPKRCCSGSLRMGLVQACCALGISLFMIIAHLRYIHIAEIVSNASENIAKPTPTPTWYTKREPLPPGSPVTHVVHSPNANFGKLKSAADTLVVVAARELFVGCYDFERFLSLRFETLYVFDERFVDIWKMKEMIRDADRDVTLGAHLAVANGSIGEQSARRLALDLMDSKFEVKPEFVFSVNCDTHPIPEYHKMYDSVEQLTTKLSAAFKQQKRIRSSGEGALVQGKNVTREHNDIFAMNTLLWEYFRHPDNMDNAVLHGGDWWGWNANHKKKGKPKEMIVAGTPWMTPVNHFTECHAIMMDREKMELTADQYFVADSLPSEPRSAGRLARNHGWSVVRNNELHMYQNFAPQDRFKTARYKKLNETELEYMKLLNFELLALHRNPKACCDIVLAYEAKDFHMQKKATSYGTGFIPGKYKPFWLPRSIKNSPAGTEWARRWIDAGMKIAGWKKTGEDTEGKAFYEPEGCIQTTLAITQDLRDKVTEGHVFLRLRVKGLPLSIVTWHPWRVTVGPDYPKERRYLELPLSNDTIIEKAASPADFDKDYNQDGGACIRDAPSNYAFNEL